MDTEYISQIFNLNGWTSEIVPLNELPILESDAPVLLTSSEDRFGLYKSFIESIVSGIETVGRLCIPRFELIKSHHNKVHMEILKSIYIPESRSIFKTRYYGTVEDLSTFKDDGIWPKVLKRSSSAGADGVFLVADSDDLRAKASKISRSLTMPDTLLEFGTRINRRDYVKRSLHRKSFVVQEFIADLSNDYKVVVYGERYYVVRRANRPNDFRASGSGLLDFDLPFDDKLLIVLNFARRCYNQIRSPMLSLDIALRGSEPILFEFQCISFGPMTAERSQRHYSFNDDKWKVIDGPCDLERTFVDSIIYFIENG